MGDETFRSIDEIAVSSGRLNIETAIRNIHQLQQHVFCNNFQQPMMAYGGNTFLKRQESVTDEEMFGDGNEKFAYGNSSRHMDDNADDRNSMLPNFSLLSIPEHNSNQDSKVLRSNVSSSGRSPNNTLNNEDFEMSKKMLCEAPDGESSGFKLQYLYRRSVSDARENSSGSEVHYDSIPEQVEQSAVNKQFRKSNSLPDLVCSSLSPGSPTCFHSDTVVKPECPDKDKDSDRLMEKYEQKVSLEGPSSVPIKRSNSSKRPKLNRRVSFMDDENQDSDQSKTKKSVTTPTEERRLMFRSSGYHTGSEESSQDKSEKMDGRRKNSQISQGSSNVWTSQESEKVDDSQKDVNEVSHVSDKTSKEISHDTEQNKNSDTSCSSSGPQITVKSNLSLNEPGEVTLQNPGVFMRLKSKDEKLSGGCGKSPDHELRNRKSYDPSSFLPKLPTFEESFQVKSSSVANVIEEGETQRKAVIEKHINRRTDCKAAPTQSSAGTKMPSSLQGAFKSSRAMHSPPDDVKKLEQILIQEDFSPHQLYDILDDQASCSSPSPTPNNIRNQSYTDFSATDLIEASRCRYAKCDVSSCIKLREVLHTLEKRFLSSDQTELQKNYFKALHEHSILSECSEIKCCVRFCQEVTEWQTQLEDTITVETLSKRIQHFVNFPCMGVALTNSNNITPIMLQKGETKPEAVDFDTYTPLFPLGKFGNAVVYLENQTDRLLVITKFPVMDYKHQLSLYARISGLTHPNIVTQLWLVNYEEKEKIQVCSMYLKGGNLKDYMRSVGPLPWQIAVLYMRQLLSAISCLQNIEYGVIYLYWLAENCLFTDCSRRVIQLGNFSLACAQGHQLDYGALKTCLPYNICPPELIHHNSVDFKSDSWGLGCLFYEMVSGTEFLHDRRHHNQSVVHSEVKNGTRPDLTNFKPEIKSILESCWQIQTKHRVSVDEMSRQMNLISVKVT